MKHRPMQSLLQRLVLLALALAPGAGVAADPPRPPEEVFRYAIFDAGDALEIDWAVDDGAYMYRDAFGFVAADPAIVLGEPSYPPGELHTDEFLGEQTIYRDTFFLRIPYTVSGTKPGTLALTIESRGCLDSGFCYAPQSWVEDVPLEPVRPARDTALVPGGAAATSGTAALSGGVAGGGPDFPPPDEVFFPDLYAIDGNTVEVGFRIEPGFYLYRDKLSVRVLNEDIRPGALELPKGKLKTDEFFGEQEVYYGELVGRLSFARSSAAPTTLEIELGYQGCADGGLCYLPQTKRLSVALPDAVTVTDLAGIPVAGTPVAGTPVAGAPVAGDAPPVSEQGRLEGAIASGNFWLMIGTFFGAGLLLSLTPCVLPMVPILSGIIAGEGDNVSPARGLGLAFSYVMGMALVYTALGIAAAMAGAQLQAFFNQPWVLALFAGLFIVLALGMFGLYDLQMPNALQTKLASMSSRQKSGTVIGAFVMGALSSLIVTACVAPALIAALSFMAKTGDVVTGGTALFAMSLGMGAPLLAVGAAQGKLLPKAGPWMVAIKGAFGFMFLGLAVYMLSRVLPGEVTMFLWAALAVLAGVFMGGLSTLAHEAGATRKLGKGFGLLAIFYGLVLFLGALAGGTNPLKPLASLDLGGAGGGEQHLEFTRIKSVADLDRELAAAASAGKSAMLDFYADWCVSCIEMENYTFIEPEVQAALANTVTLQADVTRNDAEDQALLKRFGIFGPPWIIFFDDDGRKREGYDVVGFMNAEDFAAHVRLAVTR
ncbi:MAG TPA: protein-disulfide reductase DsbD [Woeseiaceae bacterium]|nr:protein-disulfide reductase DsbD [Woeseiaceae bacterium]